MDEEDFVGCISCMSTKDLCDLFASFSEHVESYAKMFENCFNIKISNDLKYICAQCVQKLEDAATFKEQTEKSIAMLESIKDEEYLDETILEEGDANNGLRDQKVFIIRNPDTGSVKECDEDNMYDLDDEHAIQALDENTCIYCNVTLPTVEEVNDHIRNMHGLEPRTGLRLRNCTLCGISLMDSNDHYSRCHGRKSDDEGKQFPCHFCDNVYNSRKACFTHLRMKHGLKLSTDQGPKYAPRERKKCHMCNRDFSQKQILNKHLWKTHGIEVEKRKAFICPLCPARVSYGTQFSQHLLQVHHVHEQVERLEFLSIDDFMLYKSAIQEETKYRFRKTTASKQTIEGLRSHYMCSQSGVYVYQGKGKRPAPERQIYKTGKACPAHMVVTETMDRVLVTFHKTHVGHGTCPYYEPREPKKLKIESETSVVMKDEKEPINMSEKSENSLTWICDTCGMGFLDTEKFKNHVTSHGLNMFPCQYCNNVFQNIDAWTRHLRIEHNIGTLF